MYPIQEQRLINTFIDLARIPSPSWKESQVIAYIARELKSLKIKAELLPCGTSHNVLVRIPGNCSGKPTLLFAAHTDTVEPCDSINVVQNDTTIMTDGTSILGGDDKSAVAAFLEVIRVLRESPLPHGNLEFLFTCAEEVGLEGIKGLDFSLLEARRGFVLDSGGPVGTALVKAPYHIHYHITITGRAAHAGMEPEKGISAISVAADIINRLPKGRLDSETTLNIGKISGGKANNIVAPEATIELEFRSLNKTRIKELDKTVKDTVQATAKEWSAKVILKKTPDYNGFNIPESSPLIVHLKRACTAAKLKPAMQASGGGSDTNILNERGIPSLNLSIGMTNVHTTRESIKKVDIIKAARLILALIETA